jgi:outer membrane protein assembly factor BamE (lipoprotein component of BamABCDE complex)
MRRLLSCSLITLLCLGWLSACVQFKSKRGVEVAWQRDVVEKLIRGQSTRADVLDALGPPSQVISLQEETVLYYLFEKAEGEGMILILYNRIEVDTRYDRAIFFFDENDLLTDYSTRIHLHDDE